LLTVKYKVREGEAIREEETLIMLFPPPGGIQRPRKRCGDKAKDFAILNWLIDRLSETNVRNDEKCDERPISMGEGIERDVES
jgi:hypothetical protein